jgi:hypothetical protein
VYSQVRDNYKSAPGRTVALWRQGAGGVTFQGNKVSNAAGRTVHSLSNPFEFKYRVVVAPKGAPRPAWSYTSPFLLG